jgi:molybdopterin/thiamine biosynthesis adenylyltransferase
MKSKRFDRNIRFFGREGQGRLAAIHVVVGGIGGLGTHVVQQLALLGVGRLTLIDKEELEESNTNRYVGVRHDDPIPGTLKVMIGKRIVNEINTDIQVDVLPSSIISKEAFNAVIQADYVFGCVDRDGVRMVLNELCSAYAKPYIDLASDIIPGESPDYGGRVCISWDGQGCIACFDQLDIAEAQADLESSQEKETRDAIYGVSRDLLDSAGPSVVSINGVVASLAVTEFMLWVTGVRLPNRLSTYYGNMGRVTVHIEEPAQDCYYCKEIYGKGDSAGVQRYLKVGIDI